MSQKPLMVAFMSNVYRIRQPAVVGNHRIRTPQQEAYAALETFVRTDAREAGVVLPVGCGKSGCIALAPFAFRATRVLVVAGRANCPTALRGLRPYAGRHVLFKNAG